jgi:hypothetical protein
MALWGISTTTETAANQYNLPKYVHQVARSNSRHDVFADVRGWVQRHYKTQERSGISTRYSDEVLVPIGQAGLAGTGGYSTSLGSTLPGLGLATPVAVFFEDPNKASNISVGSGGTSGIGTGKTGYVHLVFNELVFAGAGSTVVVQPYTSAGVTTGTSIVAYAASVTPGVTVANWTYQYPANGVTGTASGGPQLVTNYNGQITNRVAFAFTAPTTGIGTVLRIDTGKGFVGVITDIYFGTGVTSSFASDIIRNVGGAGTAFSVQKDGVTLVGIGTTTLTVTA